MSLLSDEPERRSAYLRPSILGLAEQLERVLHASPKGGGIRLHGPRGSGRSTLLHAIGARIPHAWLDLRTVPADASILCAAVGAMLRHHDPKTARRARVACQRLATASTFNRHAPGATEPIDELLSVLPTTRTVLLVDGDPRHASELSRSIRILRDAPVVWVVTTPPDSPIELPVAIDLARLDPNETAALAPLLATEGEALSSEHVAALQELFAHPIFANPRRLKEALRRLSLLRAFEGDAIDGDDAAMARWVGTVTLWPGLARALRDRDAHWWRDLRLALDQAMPVRPDPLATDLLDTPGFGPWMSTHIPRPGAAAPRAFAAALEALRAAQARLDRWGL